MNLKYVLLYCVVLLVFSCKQKDARQPIALDSDVKTTPPILSTSTFLSLSDVHLDSTIDDTEFGYNNDTGKSLWKRAKTKIESVVKAEQPKFMVYLGDLPHHEDSMRRTNVQLMLENLRNLNIDIPILYLPGNNDSLGGDYHSFTDSVDETPFTTDSSAKNPWPVLNRSTTSTTVNMIDFKQEFGYYAADVITGKDTLKVVALNTVIFTAKDYDYNSHHVKGHHHKVGDDGISQQAAAQDQMQWFEGILDSFKATDRILIMMHIPPGIDGHGGGYMWNYDLKYLKVKATDSTKLQNGFLEEIEAHQPQIVGVLHSHTHLDGLRRLYNSHHSDDKNRMIGLAIATPGITIGHGNNPAFKLFRYQEKTFNLLDFETHFAVPTVITKSEKEKAKDEGRKPKPNSTFVFQGDSLYTFKEAYHSTNSSETIYDVIHQMDSTNIINNMNSILGTKSNQDVSLIYHNAINVHKKY